MSEPVRIVIRIASLALFAASFVALIAVVVIGPPEIAEKMGKSCAHNSNYSEWCTWRDAVGLLEIPPWTALVGAVGLLLTRPESSGGPDGGNRFTMPATVAVLVLLVVTFAGSYVYRGAYHVSHGVRMAEKVYEAGKNTDFTGGAKHRAPKAKPPKGLAKGSLLRADAFGKAIADIRRAAPGGAKLVSLRVAPEQVDATVLARGRNLRMRRPWDGKATVLSRTPSPNGDSLISFARLDAKAPQRITIAAAKATDSRPQDVTHMVLIDAVGLRWNAFAGTELVSASPDGRTLR